MAEDTRKVVVTRCPVSGASELVYQEGWLAEAYKKANAEIVLLQSLPKEEHVKHTTQEAPLAFRDGGNVPPIWSHSRGTDTIVIGLSAILQSHAIIVAPDSAIRSPEDLRGKRLGLPARDTPVVNAMRAMALRGYLTVLNAYGIGRDEVEFIDIYPDDREKQRHVMKIPGAHVEGEELSVDPGYVPSHMADIDALRDGKIDAFFSHRSLVWQLVSRAYGRILIDIAASELPKVNNIYPSVITVDRSFAEKNRDLVVTYLKELLRASDWEKEHPEEAIRIGTGGQFGSTYEDIRNSRPEGWDARFRPSLDDDLIELLRQQKEFLLEEHFIENDFDLDGWIDRSFLEEAEKTYKEENYD